jgi:nitroreductase
VSLFSREEDFMDALEAICQRPSIRAFKKEPVEREVIEKILEDATRAPSASNQQPWDFMVVGGDALKNLTQKLLEAQSGREFTYDAGHGRTLPERYADRTERLFTEIHPFVEKTGQGAMTFILEGSLSFYGAPVAILVLMDKSLGKSKLVDIGAALQNLLLSAHARGLGTCALGLILMYKALIKEELEIPDTMDIILGVALGYPDSGSPLDGFRSSREKTESLTTWKGL